LSVQVDAAKPGALATVRVVLTQNGTPLPNAPVLLSVEGQPAGLQGMTDRDGTARFLLPQGNATLRLSARYAGSGALAPTSAVAVLAPVVPETVLHQTLRYGTWIAAGAAALLAAGAYALHRLRRHPLAPALRRARRALLGTGPYEAQILRAYELLEDAAIEHELLAAPANTPRDLEAAVAPTLPRPLHTTLDTLITLFEQAPHRQAA